MVSFPKSKPEDVPDSMISRQHVWEDFGLWFQQQIAKCPESYIIRAFPYASEPWGLSLIEHLGSLEGKTFLDLGCGVGRLTVYAAKNSGIAIGIDIKLEVIQAARSITAINEVKCEFQLGNVCKLPFVNNSIDIIVGIDILHHLSRPDAQAVFNEVYRVLRNGGKAFFVEPVENSRVFNFIQNLFPAGRKSSGYYRPSCLCPRAWTRYLAEHDGRDITCKELTHLGAPFKKVSLKAFGLLGRIDRFVKDRRLIHFIRLADHWIFAFLPFLRLYSRQVIVEYQK